MFSAIRRLDQEGVCDDSAMRSVWKWGGFGHRKYPGRIRAMFATLRPFVAHLLQRWFGDPVPVCARRLIYTGPPRPIRQAPACRVLIPEHLLTTVHATAPPRRWETHIGQEHLT